MKQLISTMLARLDAGERVMLCMILDNHGSSPREAGAKMAVFADSSILGTVGGGSVERRAIREGLALLQEGRCAVREYLLRPNEGDNLGMICGGDILLGYACLKPENTDHRAALAQLYKALDSSANAWLKTDFFPDETSRLTVILREDIHRDGARLPTQPQLLCAEGCTTLLEPIARDYQVVLFGGGHVGKALVPALAAVGFPVTVLDDRPDFAQPERFPAAKRVLLGDFHRIFDSVQIRPQDYVIVMTPGHLVDYEVLRQVLTTEATYIGCIGSHKKVAYVNDQLRADGFSEAEIARIHAPIGLPIGAQTPEEIAVSITAELILHRAGAPHP